MSKPKKSFTTSPQKLTSGEYAQIRNAAPAYDLIRAEEKEEEARRKDGISANFTRLYINQKKSDGEVLETALRHKQTGDLLNKVLRDSIADGRIVTPEEQRMLLVATEIMSKLHKNSAALFIAFDNMRAGSGLPIGYKQIEIVDG